MFDNLYPEKAFEVINNLIECGYEIKGLTLHKGYYSFKAKKRG